MEELLTYKSVEIAFNGRAVVHDVSFALHPGEILGIVGESGSGKSTILKAAMGLLGNGGMVTRGDIWFRGEDLPDLNEKDMRRIRGAGIGMIFQDAGASLCPIRTIGSQIYESMSAHGKLTKAEAKEKALMLFEKLHFQDSRRIWDSYPFELSGGMNQRAGIAIAMLMEPPGAAGRRAHQRPGCGGTKAGGAGNASPAGFIWNGYDSGDPRHWRGVRHGGYGAGAEGRQGDGVWQGAAGFE